MARKRRKLKARHIRFAASTKYEKPKSFFEGKSAEQIIEEGFKEIERLGYRVVYRKRGSSSITGIFTLYLGKNFKNYHPIFKAAILWHEIVHANQWRDLNYLFAMRYPWRRWQWALETQGYRQQVRVIWVLAGDDRALKEARRIPGSMQKKPYTMRRLDSKHIRRETLKAFRRGLPGLVIR